MIRALAVSLVALLGCVADTAGPIETHETDRALYSDAFDRWMYFGFGMAEDSTCYGERSPNGWPALVYPREVFATGAEFERLCNGAVAREADGSCSSADGCAVACQAYVPGTHDPLIVLVSHLEGDERRLRKFRAHEAYHWIAECSGVATEWANEHHAVGGVWAPVSYGDDYLMQAFETQ